MPTIDLSEINWLAVLVAAIASFIIGALIYGVTLRKTWIALHKYTEADIQKASASQGRELGIIFACDLVTAAMFALFAAMLNVAGPFEGISLGFLAWLGFVATTQLVHNAAHRKPAAAYLIDIGYHLASLLAMGAIIGAWR